MSVLVLLLGLLAVVAWHAFGLSGDEGRPFEQVWGFALLFTGAFLALFVVLKIYSARWRELQPRFAPRFVFEHLAVPVIALIISTRSGCSEHWFATPMSWMLFAIACIVFADPFRIVQRWVERTLPSRPSDAPLYLKYPPTSPWDALPMHAAAVILILVLGARLLRSC